MNVMDSIIWGLWWKNNRHDGIIDMTDCGYGNGETVKMDKFDRL